MGLLHWRSSKVCRHCKAKLATNAKACPHCGHRFVSASTQLAQIGCALLFIPLLIILLMALLASTS